MWNLARKGGHVSKLVILSSFIMGYIHDSHDYYWNTIMTLLLTGCKRVCVCSKGENLVCGACVCGLGTR